jgi:hypothetical protein
VNVFETDRKRLVVRAQCLPSYQATTSPPRKQQVCNNCHSYVTNQNPTLNRLQRPLPHPSRHVRFGEENFLVPSENRTPECPACSLVTIPTELIITKGVTDFRKCKLEGCGVSGVPRRNLAVTDVSEQPAASTFREEERL